MKRLDIAIHGGHNGRIVYLTQPFTTPDIETGHQVDAVVKAVGETAYSDVPSVCNAVGRVVTLAGERQDRDEHESKKLHARRGTVGMKDCDSGMVAARACLDRIRPMSIPSKSTWMDRIAPIASSRSGQTSSADATGRITRCQPSIFTDTAAYHGEPKAPPPSWNRSTPGRCRTSTSSRPKALLRERGSGGMVDAHALGACGLGRAGSNPASPTRFC